jgi:hypothetical protein
MAANAAPVLAIAPQGQAKKEEGQWQKVAHKSGLRGRLICSL